MRPSTDLYALMGPRMERSVDRTAATSSALPATASTAHAAMVAHSSGPRRSTIAPGASHTGTQASVSPACTAPMMKTGFAAFWVSCFW